MIKTILNIGFAAWVFCSCTPKATIDVTVSNTSSLDRENEIVEVAMNDIYDKLQLADTAQFIVLDNQGMQVPYQITYDDKLIFPVNVKANSAVTYCIEPGVPETFATKACGKQYPERMDDVAWENDRMAFRTYGPALQATGEKAFGYDVWVKRSEEMVVEERYAMELNDSTHAKIVRLSKSDPEAAKALREATSYHYDHGNGLDYYKVGPTLGAGTAALYVNDSIQYPYCYVTQEVLDNGPLRFTVKLAYAPLVIKGDSTITETRIVSLDAGSQLNKTVITFENTKQTMPVVTGISIHEPSTDYTLASEKGYITYADPIDSVNGQTYVAAVFPINVKEAKVANGHVLALSDYEPSSEYTYYWGAGWSKFGFSDVTEWVKYIDTFAHKVRNPLTVTVD